MGGLPKAGRDVEGIVEMMLDATGNFREPLTKTRLFAWHASLFPTGRSGMNEIAVGQWRPKEAGEMRVVSGPFGHERVHFEASKYAKIAKCSSDTALRDIRELLDRGILLQNERGGRSTSYRLAEPEAIPI